MSVDNDPYQTIILSSKQRDDSKWTPVSSKKSSKSKSKVS